MRISTLMFSQNYLPQLNQLQQSQQQLQSEASSGLNMTLPEDNPAMMAQVLNLQSQSSANAQYQNNITQLQSSAATVANPINQIQNLVSLASQTALGVGGTTGHEDLTNDASTVEGYIKSILQFANSKDASGNYLFGGSNTTTPPFVATTDASGNITGVTYQGDTNVSSGQIAPNISVTTQIPGANTTGTGPTGLLVDSASGVDVFSHLISLQKNLASFNTTAVNSTDAPNLEADDNHLIGQISANGVVQSTLETTSNSNLLTGDNLSTQISTDTNANLANTLSSLTQTQTAYQAALESGVMVMNLSILQYIQ